MDNQQPVLPAPTPETDPNIEDMKITIQPKKNCRKCHGLGRIGFVNGDQNNPLICSCVIKIYTELQKQIKIAKAKEIKDEKNSPEVVQQPETKTQS